MRWTRRPSRTRATRSIATGSIRLRTPVTGCCELSFRGPPQRTPFRASTELSLDAGKNAFELDVPTGEVFGVASPDRFAQNARVDVRTTTDSGLFFEASFRRVEDGAFVLSTLPAGPALVSQRTTDGETGTKDSEVSEGGAVEFTLPSGGERLLGWCGQVARPCARARAAGRGHDRLG